MEDKINKLLQGLQLCIESNYSACEQCPYSMRQTENKEACDSLMLKDVLEVIQGLRERVKTLEKEADKAYERAKQDVMALIKKL